MSEVNSVELRGSLKIYKAARSKNDTAWARGSIQVGKIRIPVKAFHEAAEALGNADGLMVTVVGHLEKDAPPKNSDQPQNQGQWSLVVVVDKVHEHAPGERKGNAPKAQAPADSEEIPF